MNAVSSENVLPATLFPRSGKDKQETLLRRSVVSDFVTHPSRNTGIELFLLCIFFLFLLFFSPRLLHNADLQFQGGDRDEDKEPGNESEIVCVIDPSASDGGS